MLVPSLSSFGGHWIGQNLLNNNVNMEAEVLLTEVAT